MLNLHAPFRRATAADTAGAAELAPSPHDLPAGAVVSEENGRLTAVMAGAPEGESWRIQVFAVAPARSTDLGPRLLALADALAAEDECSSVAVEETLLSEELRAAAMQEGFRKGGTPGGSNLLVRKVVAQA